MPQHLTKPANSVLVAGTPFIIEMEIGANATAAKMLPKRLVILDTNTGEIKECGAKANNIHGVLMEAPDKLITTAYAVGDQAKVIVGGPCIVVCKLTSGGMASPAVVQGDYLVSGADGKVQKEAVGAMGAQGMRIGQAWEAVNPTSADADVMVLLNKSADMKAAA
jgi:hypothetical protein